MHSDKCTNSVRTIALFTRLFLTEKKEERKKIESKAMMTDCKSPGWLRTYEAGWLFVLYISTHGTQPAVLRSNDLSSMPSY